MIAPQWRTLLTSHHLSSGGSTSPLWRWNTWRAHIRWSLETDRAETPTWRSMEWSPSLSSTPRLDNIPGMVLHIHIQKAWLNRMFEREKKQICGHLEGMFEKYFKQSCLLIAVFKCTQRSRCCTILAIFTHSHTHSYTDGGGCRARRQLFIRSNLFSILLKDTSTYSWIWTSNLPTTRRPALPPELQPLFIKNWIQWWP